MTVEDFWTSRGATVDTSEAAARAPHFGRPAAEARVAAGGQVACLTPLLAVTPLRLTGADRAPFLHGQLSNGVQGLPAGACNHTLQLDARGRVVGEASLCVREGDIFLAVEDARGPQVLASLEAHIVFDDVRVEDLTGRMAAFTLQGTAAKEVAARVFGDVPEAGRYAAAALADGTATEGDAPALLLSRARSAAGGVDVHLPAGRLPQAIAALEAAGAELVGEDALALMRVLGGVPSAAREGAAGGLPQELGLASAVSFGKGCYLGQEIMARIEARGAVRKALTRVRVTQLPAGLVPAGLEGRALRADGREVGRLGTVTALPDGGLAALAVLRLDLAADAALAVEDDGGTRLAAVEPWPLEGASRGTGAAVGDAATSGGVQPGGPGGSGL